MRSAATKQSLNLTPCSMNNEILNIQNVGARSTGPVVGRQVEARLLRDESPRNDWAVHPRFIYRRFESGRGYNRWRMRDRYHLPTDAGCAACDPS